MPDFNAIYDRLRQSGMNDWVGGADPALVGDICCRILFRHIQIGPETRLLDFGAGIGRVMLSVLRQRPEVKAITGIDIVAPMVTFCREAIASEFPQTSFELLAERNVHYERYKDSTPGRTRNQISQAYAGSFDGAYAFSVFTHVDVGDFVPSLKFVASMLKPGAVFLFTVFALTPYSRAKLATRQTNPPFAEQTFEQGGDVFIGNEGDRLAFIGYDIRRLEAMIWEAGLIPCAVEYGEWRSAGFSESYQDVIVCRKPIA